MNELVPDRLDAPLTRSAMAKEAGVSPTTLANWENRAPMPLVTVRAPNGDAMHTWRHLLVFCKSHPNLGGSRKVFDRFRRLVSDDPPNRSQDLSLAMPADGTSSVLDVSRDGATLRSAVEDLKAEVEAQAALVASTSRLAREVERGHSCLQQRLDALEVALVAASL